MKRPERGTAIVIAGLGFLVLVLVGSAVLAPDITTANPGTEVIVGSQGGGVGLHEHGSIYLLEDQRRVWDEDDADSYFDVSRLDNGSYLVGFMDGGFENCGPYDAPCSRTGFRIIDPEPEPHITSEYSFPVRSKQSSEVHAASKLPSGEYLIGDMDRERVFTVNVNSEITWQWNASEFYTPPEDPTSVDWLHLNDVDYIGEDRYLVSIRNANQILILERGAGVVEVINEDRKDADDGSCQDLFPDEEGDKRCGNPDVIDHQHNPQWLNEDAILIGDSENDRVVELHRNESGVWEPAWVLSGADGEGFDWPRDADRLPNGNTLITDSRNKRLLEVNESGDVLWSKNTDPMWPYEADMHGLGEPLGGPTYDGDTATQPDGGSGEIPILSTMLLGIQSVYPDTPYWFEEPQLLATLISIVVMTAGLVTRIRFD